MVTSSCMATVANSTCTASTSYTQCDTRTTHHSPHISPPLSADDIERRFYFESDHVALKGNRDYRHLLQTVAMLESQRTKAIQDLETLHNAKDDALDDPIRFVERLQRHEELGLAGSQRVCEVPYIDWEYYTSSCDPAQFKMPKHGTRLNRRHGDHSDGTTSELRPETPPLVSDIESMSMAGRLTPMSSAMDYMSVRGRVSKHSKSNTFNQLWTGEEQRRLEELLEKVPPEEVEMRRWEKIATALGHRTATQVQSRVQKYFLKLAKSGLPIPGRTPYMPPAVRRRQTRHQHHRHHKFLYPSSTFLQSHEPPVYMDDDDDTESYHSYGGSMADYSDLPTSQDEQDISDDEAVPVELRTTPEYRELLRLKNLRRHRQAETHRSHQHVGYKCDRCECEPIIGVRWHCVDCPVDTSMDFCENCTNFVFERGSHQSSHTLEPVQEAECGSMLTTHLDSDYTKFLSGDYNYLDPNYMPAT